MKAIFSKFNVTLFFITFFLLCLIFPMYWMLVHSQWILFSMFTAIQGYIYFGGCFIAAIVIDLLVLFILKFFR